MRAAQQRLLGGDPITGEMVKTQKVEPGFREERLASLARRTCKGKSPMKVKKGWRAPGGKGSSEER